MSSGQEYINCPVCNSPDCFAETNCRTLEQYVSCFKCGYKYVFKWKRDEEGNFILEDKEKGKSLDNFIPDEYELKNPYGSFLIKNARGGSKFGSLKDQEDFNNFQKNIEEARLEGDISEVTVRRYVEGRFIVIKLKHGLLAENDDLWEYSEECGSQLN